MAERKKASGETRTPDDRKDRRTIIVPIELWDHVERWGKEQDKKDSGIIRDCIKALVDREQYLLDLREQAQIYYTLSVLHWRNMNKLVQQMDTLADSEIRTQTLKIAKAVDDLRSTALSNIRDLVDHRVFSDPVFGIKDFQRWK